MWQIDATQTGWAGKLFNTPICLQQAVTTSWLKHIWLMTQSFIIHIHTGFILPPTQHGDIEVMRLFLQHGYHKPEVLLSLNCCQMYLHAFLLSDLCIGTGNLIDHGLWESHVPCHSNWHWPKSIPSLKDNW